MNFKDALKALEQGHIVRMASIPDATYILQRDPVPIFTPSIGEWRFDKFILMAADFHGYQAGTPITVRDDQLNAEDWEIVSAS